MARKHTRRHSRKHIRRHSSSKKNILNKGMETVKSTSNKYMPKVKTGLETVGSKVTTTAQKSVPFLQKTMRNLFSKFSTKKNRKH